jgi:5-methylcytosine-specific restriction protein A
MECGNKMPMRAAVGCNFPACRGIAVDGTSYCETHQKKNVDVEQREKDKQRYRSSPWRKLYDTKAWYAHLQPACLARDPLCKLQITPLCRQHGGDGTVIADHRIDHRGNPQLFYDLNNLQGACRACHDAKPKPRNGELPVNDLSPIGSESAEAGGKIFTSAMNSKAVEAALLDTEDLSDVTIP